MSAKNSIEKLFKNKDLYRLALTHKSWVNENKGKRESNERLEYLGDAILEFIVSKEIFKQFPDKSEGYLTALRANLVNTVNLSEVANKLNLGEKLSLSKGEEEGGGRENASILANTIEAVIGALYLDSGISKCEEFIDKHLLVLISKKISKPLKDAKSRLQELVQSKGLPAPKYKVIKEYGPDHQKRFKIEVLIDNKAWGCGVGKNKAEAAQEAARKALAKSGD
jgi:ribonuclease-3